MNSVPANSASSDSDLDNAGPTPPPIFDDAPADHSGDLDHNRSPLAEPMQDPFAPPAIPPTNEQAAPQHDKVRSPVPAAPKFATPQDKNSADVFDRSPEPIEVPSAPESVSPMPMPMPIPSGEEAAEPQSWVEPKLWPRHNGAVEPAIVVQPRDFHARSTAWSAQ